MYLRLKDNNIEFPFELCKLRLENPNTSFPAELTPEILLTFGIFEVIDECPVYNAQTQFVSSSSTPTLIDGIWRIEYIISEILLEQKIENFISKSALEIQTRLDNLAFEKGYDNIVTVISYANCANQAFSEEGIYCRDLRANVWSSWFLLADQFRNSEITLLENIEEVFEYLPEIKWP